MFESRPRRPALLKLRSIKRLLLNFFKWCDSHVSFTIYIIGWVALLIFITPILAELLDTTFHTAFKISDFILYITAAFLVATTYETKRMREQTRETDLRPVILRSGYIEAWEQIKFSISEDGRVEGKYIEFNIQKGIATDINGYIILDKKKYPLLFGNLISKKSEDSISFNKRWGWLAEGNSLFAAYHPDDFISTKRKNCIYLYYRNIEGKEYYTTEYEDFSQESFAV